MFQKDDNGEAEHAWSDDWDSDDFADATRVIREGMADEAAGRIRSITEVDEMIRRELGFAL